MEIGQLKYFLAAAQTQNFRKAAELCNVAQSVLSRQIAGLEAELGLLLFKRIDKRVVLSAAGQEFAIYARSALEQLQQGQQAMVELKVGERGSIAIGCVEALATTYLPAILANFNQRYPHIHSNVTVRGADDLMALVEQGTLDFGLIFSPITRPELLVVRELFRQPLQLVTAMQHPLALAKPAHVFLEQVASEPLVVFREGFGLRRIMDALFTRRGYPLQPVVEIDSIEAMKELVKHGVGVTLMPLALIRPEQIGHELMTFPIADFSEEFVFALVYRRFGTMGMAARALLDSITATTFQQL